MMREGLSGEAEDVRESKQESLWMTVLTAFGTSIDSMIVGVGLAFMEVNIAFAAAVIGMAATVMVTIGLTAGKAFWRIVRQACGICRRFGVDCHRYMDALIAFGFDSMMSENKMPSEALPVSDGILLNLILYRYYCVKLLKIKY